MFDFLIKNANIIDGTGKKSFIGDLAVIDNLIVNIGKNLGYSKNIFDAEGLSLCPGIIDSHTHYDAQLTWDNKATPSLSLGVTTILIGNCGFTIAPCKSEHRSITIKNLTKVEGMSLSSLEEGIKWDYESYGEYLNMIEKKGIALNVASYIGHSSIRLFVMGEEAMQREAENNEIEEMERIVIDCMRNGAIGLATSTFEGHNGDMGVPMPSRFASKNEHKRLVNAMSKFGRGIYMLTKGSETSIADIEMIIKDSNRPALVAAILHNPLLPCKAKKDLDDIKSSSERGNEIWGQVSCRPLTMEFTMREPYMFEGLKTWKKILSKKSFSEKIKVMGDKEFRNDLSKEIKDLSKFKLFNGDWQKVFLLKTSLELLKKYEGKSIVFIAKKEKKDALDWLLDSTINGGVNDLFIAELLNSDHENVEKLLNHSHSMISLSDAGAHLSYFCDAGFGLHLLDYWVREKKIMTIEKAIYELTGKQADICRIPNRGRLVPGNYADMVLFDPSKIRVKKSFRINDLPSNAERLIAESDGIYKTWVNGVEVMNKDNNSLPGMMIRSYYS